MNGVSLSRLARLQPDGSLDPGFNPGAGASDTVLTLVMQSDGGLVAGGLFTTYDGTNVGMIARVDGDPVTPTMTAGLPDSGHIAVSWPAWATGYALQTTERLQPVDWQRVTNQATLRDDRLSITLPLAAASQFYRLISQ